MSSVLQFSGRFISPSFLTVDLYVFHFLKRVKKEIKYIFRQIKRYIIILDKKKRYKIQRESFVDVLEK